MDVISQLKANIRKDVNTGNLRLPAIPDVVFRVREMLMDENQSIDKVSQAVQLEHALATRLVRIANSPMYRGMTPISSCNAAITRLGLSATQNLATSLALKNAYLGDNENTHYWLHQIWEESCRVAAISQVLGSVTVGVNADKAMLAGLIHNIGALPLVRYLEPFPDFMRERGRVETLLGGLQGKMGALLLRYWSFEEDLRSIPLHANDWMHDNGSPRPDYLDIVLVARAHYKLQEQSEDFRPELLMQMPSFRKLPFRRLGPEASFELLERSREQVEHLFSLLYGKE